MNEPTNPISSALNQALDWAFHDSAGSDIEIIETERGFHLYGDPVTTTYGHEVHVYESSAAKGPHCWLKIEPGETTTRGNAAHLSLEQAIAIRDRLDAFIAEVPGRWSHPEAEGTSCYDGATETEGTNP